MARVLNEGSSPPVARPDRWTDATVLRRGRWRIYVASTLADSVTVGFALVVAACAEARLGAGPAELGYLGTAFMGAYAVACIALGGWSDRVGSRTFVRSSLLLTALVVVPLTGFLRELDSVAVFYGTNALYGIVLAFFWPPLMRQLSIMSSGKMLWRSLGVFNVFWAVGITAGSYGGPFLYERFGWVPALGVLIGVEGLALLLLCGPLPAERPMEEAAPSEAVPDEAVDPRVGALYLRLARVAHFCVSFALGGVGFVFLYVTSSLGIGLETLGLILLVKELGRVVSFAGLWANSGWHYSAPWLFGAQLVGGAALIVSAFGWEPWHFMALFFVVGLLSGVSYYSSLYYGLNLRKAEGRASGIHEGILATGFCLGPLVSGNAGALWPEWPGIVLAVPGVVVLAGLAVQIIWHARASVALLPPAAGRPPPTSS